MKILIKNIKALVGVRENGELRLEGKEMRSLPIIENAFLAVEDDLIVDYGSMDDLMIDDWNDIKISTRIKLNLIKC